MKTEILSKQPEPPLSSSSVWDRAAASYDASREVDEVYMSCIRQANNKIPHGTNICLDAGCGTGLSTLGFAVRAKVVVAVDYSYESLKTLKSKGVPHINPVQADLKALPFKESAFDASACINALQHFRPGAPQEKVIVELRRVTKNKGRIIISVHHYSKGKQRDGWIKEGKPGQPGIDYIFRFRRGDLLAIMPKVSTRAVGYYRLLVIPFIGRRVQNIVASLFARIAAVMGYGHMLIGIEQNNK
jgi:ubiquinone/menaquinone biosynthesis C-methylase UbiE